MPQSQTSGGVPAKADAAVAETNGMTSFLCSKCKTQYASQELLQQHFNQLTMHHTSKTCGMGLETAACWATRRGRCRPQSECAVWATNPWTPQADRATSPWNHAASWEHQRPIHPIGFVHDCRRLILPSATLNVTVDEIVEVDKIVLPRWPRRRDDA
ncbi:hypothetical protein BD309DRAFT_773378 [Dichomitus squalens]|nr:hypothetical protein BD309DRAFT_773378 [Dichomitus squalens]